MQEGAFNFINKKCFSQTLCQPFHQNQFLMGKMFLPQSELAVDPVLYVANPEEQEVQEVAPAVDEYVPTGHVTQTVPLR